MTTKQYRMLRSIYLNLCRSYRRDTQAPNAALETTKARMQMVALRVAYYY